MTYYVEKVHFGGTMHYLPQRLKSTFIEIFPSGGSPKETWSEEKNSITLELVFEVNTLWVVFTITSKTKINNF